MASRQCALLGCRARFGLYTFRRHVPLRLPECRQRVHASRHPARVRGCNAGVWGSCCCACSVCSARNTCAACVPTPTPTLTPYTHQAIVLLKNDNGALPLSTSSLAGKSVAVFGISANDTNVQQGGYVNSRCRCSSPEWTLCTWHAPPPFPSTPRCLSSLINPFVLVCVDACASLPQATLVSSTPLLPAC